MTATTTDDRRARHDRALVRAVAAPVVLLVATVVGACGLSTNDEPVTIRDNVPPEPTETEAAAPDSPGAETETVSVYFLRADGLGDIHVVPTEREVPRPATQIKVLETLITEPPTDMERTAGYSTAIPEDVTVTDEPRQTGDGVLVVNLSDAFYDLQGETARNAFAQIVFTATELPGVQRVQFERDGEIFSAVDGDGQSSRAPLGQGSFDKLRPVPGAEPDPTVTAATDVDEV